MKKCIFFLLSFMLFTFYTYGQCNIDFGSSSGQFVFATQSGSDIVNGASSGANDSSTQSFDIWDEINGDCSVAGGIDDITFNFEVIHAFDQYSVDGVIDAFAGSTHDISQTTSGLRGAIPLGNSSANETSTADVRGYKITITFASHTNVLAEDVIVNLTSVNTAGGAHESCSLVFLDGTGSPYGTATYDGYYMGTSGASTDGSCTAPGARTDSWSTSGNGVYTASSTTTTSIVDPCNPSGNTNGTGDNNDVDPVMDTGLSAGDQIGGIIFTVYLEDVAASTAPGAQTNTSTSFTSTLNGIDITGLALPVELIAFDAKLVEKDVILNWSTDSEVNNDFFDIQWSPDGLRFESIGFEMGQGNSFEKHEYSFLHKTPGSGNNYYRLKQVDFNGRFDYSEIRNVKIDRNPKVLVYPTIVDDLVNIIKPEKESQVAIFNLNQQVVKSIQTAEQLVQFNIQDLPKGTYFVSVISTDEVITEIIVKQ